MADNGAELRGIVWSQAFPFVRLFRTLRMALDVKRLVLALACVLISYLGGRLIFDPIWSPRGGVAAIEHEGRRHTEIEAYAAGDHAAFEAWRRAAIDAREELAVRALIEAGKAADVSEARQKLARSSLRALLLDEAFETELAALRELVDQRLDAGLEAINQDEKASRADRRERREALIQAADTVRMMLAGSVERRAEAAAERAAAITTIVAADPQVAAEQRADEQARLTTAAATQGRLEQYAATKPRGPFISLLTFESRCFAAAIEGVCAGRWGFSGGAFDAQPAMAGSIESALRGGCWLLNQRPWFALLCGLFSLVVFAYFGGALCRSAAVESARDESISMGDALGFVREKFGGFLLAPLLPVIVGVGIAVLMFLGGLIGAIPFIGELFTGVFYPLALLGGFALALVALATILGFHLMWPTIAVEGSDGFDALSRACSYVGSRIWHVGFYSFVLLLYGGVSFVLLRVVAVLVLKLSHKFTGWGVNLVSSAELDGVGKLEAMWQMPAWADLALLPTAGGVPLWGAFASGPLNGTETLGSWLLTLWVFLLVGLLGAFVVSFFFCGSTQMYFLLRRDVDATDWEEVYYEEPEEELPPSEVTPQPTGVPAAEAAVPKEEGDKGGEAADAPGQAAEAPNEATGAPGDEETQP